MENSLADPAPEKGEDLMFNPNLIMNEVWETLNSNATLQGANYLKATGKIWKWRKADRTELPMLIIKGSRSVSEAEAERWNLIVIAYTHDLDNGTPDSSRLGRIIGEVSDTLHTAFGNQSAITISGGRITSLYEVSDTGILFDEGTPKEHLQSLFLTAFVIKD